MGGYRLDGGEDLNLLVAAFGDFEFKTSSAPCRALALARRSKASLPGLHQGEAAGAFAFTGHGQLTETSSWLTLSHCRCVDEFEGRGRPWALPGSCRVPPAAIAETLRPMSSMEWCVRS